MRRERVLAKCVKQLILVRKYHGITQRELSELSGLTISAVGKIETGVLTPSIKTMIALTKAATGGEGNLEITNWE